MLPYSLETYMNAPITFDINQPFLLEEVKELAYDCFEALVRPQVTLDDGGRPAVIELNTDEYIIVHLRENGSVKRYGVMDANAFQALLEVVEPIPLDDPAYPSTVAKAIDELCHYQTDGLDD